MVLWHLKVNKISLFFTFFTILNFIGKFGYLDLLQFKRLNSFRNAYGQIRYLFGIGNPACITKQGNGLLLSSTRVCLSALANTQVTFRERHLLRRVRRKTKLHHCTKKACSKQSHELVLVLYFQRVLRFES